MNNTNPQRAKTVTDEAGSDVPMDKGLLKEKQSLENEATKLAEKQKVVAAEADVRQHERKLKEATEHYENALASDVQVPVVPQENAEVVRTKALMKQAEEELNEAKARLESVRKGEDNEPNP